MTRHLLQKTILILALSMACVVLAASEAGKVTVFYYSTETMVSNYVSLKREFDRSLTKLGDFAFQPISQANTFEEVVTSNRDGLFLLSSWHLQKLQENKMDLVPILVGTRDGQTSQSYVVASSSAIGSKLSGLTIATACSHDFAHTTLSNALTDQVMVSSLQLLQVPKDLDALMSVSFGMAEAALVSEHSLQAFRLSNPSQGEVLQVVAKGQKTMLPVLAASQQLLPEAQQQLVTIIQQMATSLIGRQKLQMLGIDGWLPYGQIRQGGS